MIRERIGLILLTLCSFAGKGVAVYVAHAHPLVNPQTPDSILKQLIIDMVRRGDQEGAVTLYQASKQLPAIASDKGLERLMSHLAEGPQPGEELSDEED